MESSERRILLTGATGAIGSTVLAEIYPLYTADNITVLLRPSKKATRIEKQYPGIRIIYGSVTDSSAVEKACENQDAVIHLAAVIPPYFNKNPAASFRSNVEGTRCVTESLRKYSPEAFFLYASSVAVYGDRLKNPMIEVNDPLPSDLLDEYAKSKIAAEAIVRNSGLDWCIFRLSAIMGIGNHKVSKILFHVPLETPMEIATVKDTARAFRLALNHREALSGKTFNLSGGDPCRVVYRDFLSSLFGFYGLGKAEFPENSFAKANFHCGYFKDADALEDILQFRRDTLESYYAEFKASVPGWMRFSASCFRFPVKYFLSTISEPKKALRRGDQEKIRLFFGSELPVKNE